MIPRTSDGAAAGAPILHSWHTRSSLAVKPDPPPVTHQNQLLSGYMHLDGMAGQIRLDELSPIRVGA